MRVSKPREKVVEEAVHNLRVKQFLATGGKVQQLPACKHSEDVSDLSKKRRGRK